MTESKKIKAWLPPSLKGVVAASVDGIKLGYGKKDAKGVTKDQLDRLRQATPEVEAGTVTARKTNTKTT